MRERTHCRCSPPPSCSPSAAAQQDKNDVKDSMKNQKLVMKAKVENLPGRLWIEGGEGSQPIFRHFTACGLGGLGQEEGVTLPET